MKYTKEIPITPNNTPSTPTINCTPSKSPSEKKIAPSTPNKIPSTANKYQVRQTKHQVCILNNKSATKTSNVPTIHIICRIYKC